MKRCSAFLFKPTLALELKHVFVFRTYGRRPSVKIRNIHFSGGSVDQNVCTVSYYPPTYDDLHKGMDRKKKDFYFCCCWYQDEQKCQKHSWLALTINDATSKENKLLLSESLWINSIFDRSMFLPWFSYIFTDFLQVYHCYECKTFSASWNMKNTRQVSSMIPSARRTVSLIANIVFCCFVLLDLKSTDGRTTCAKTMIPTGRSIENRENYCPKTPRLQTFSYCCFNKKVCHTSMLHDLIDAHIYLYYVPLGIFATAAKNISLSAILFILP